MIRTFQVLGLTGELVAITTGDVMLSIPTGHTTLPLVGVISYHRSQSYQR